MAHPHACLSSRSLFYTSLYLSIHLPIYPSSGVIMVNRGANVFCFPGKWNSLLFIKYFLTKLLPHPPRVLCFPILSVSSSVSRIIWFLTDKPLNFVLFTFTTWFTKPTNHILKRFQNLGLDWCSELYSHESVVHGTSTVTVSRGTWQDYNTVGNGTVTVVSLASSLTNQITFFLLLNIGHSFPGHSDHLVIEKTKAFWEETDVTLQ